MFETLVFVYQTARRHISENRNFLTLKYSIYLVKIIKTASLIHRQLLLPTEYRNLFLFSWYQGGGKWRLSLEVP